MEPFHIGKGRCSFSEKHLCITRPSWWRICSCMWTNEEVGQPEKEPITSQNDHMHLLTTSRPVVVCIAMLCYALFCYALFCYALFCKCCIVCCSEVNNTKVNSWVLKVFRWRIILYLILLTPVLLLIKSFDYYPNCHSLFKFHL